MWKAFSINDEVYMLKIINEDVYKIFISDLKDIWSKEYSEDEIITQFKESNPAVVVEDEAAITQTLQILNELDNASMIVDRSDDKIDLEINSEVIGIGDTKFKLKYRLILSKGDKRQFTEVLTVPMIHTIHYLEKQQRVLCDLIQKKDRELEEYKMEKGVISRADLVTEKFNASAIRNSSDKLMSGIYGESTKFWERFVDKYGDVEVEVMKVEVEPWNQRRKKRRVYNAKTSAKKFNHAISYGKN